MPRPVASAAARMPLAPQEIWRPKILSTCCTGSASKPASICRLSSRRRPSSSPASDIRCLRAVSRCCGGQAERPAKGARWNFCLMAEATGSGAALHPLHQPVAAPAVDDTILRNAGDPRVGERVLAEVELSDRVRVAVESEETAGCQRPSREREVHVLPVPVAVDLDRDVAGGGLGEHAIPFGLDSGAAPVNP